MKKNKAERGDMECLHMEEESEIKIAGHNGLH